MFFRSKSTSPDQQNAADVVAAFFGLLVEEVKPWIKVDGKNLAVTLPFVAATQLSGLHTVLSEAGFKDITIHSDVQARQTKVKRVPKIKNMIAVASGKGGVGKSTTSVNLAFALMQEGAKVGLLDADIYGPSVPIMLGNPDEHPGSEDQRHMFPLESHGLVANSIGYLVPPENATIWRGPMVSRALQQLLNDTLWPELDYLIIDLPPGTGDIQLTLAQQVPVTAAVVVTTPQDLALADARKGIAMFNKVDIPVLGLIENMSYYQCTNCGHKEHVFASGGGSRLGEEYGVALLAQLPLDIKIRQHADGGKPLLLDEPDSALAQTYRQAARQLSMALALNEDMQDDLAIDIVEKN